MKKDILQNANYVYNFDREIYFNRVVRKAFSLPFIDDHPEEVLARCVNESTGGNEWRFYFNSEPSEAAKRELESVFQ